MLPFLLLLCCCLQPTPLPTEGLQLNARPSKRHHHQQQQQQNGITTDNGTDAASSATPQQQQAQQQQQQQGGFKQTVLSGENQAVKVSLNDCLACSGCVTSAETVLLQVGLVFVSFMRVEGGGGGVGTQNRK